VVRLLDEVAQHRLGDLEVGDDAVLHRPDRHDVARRPAEHLLGLSSDGEHLLDARRAALHRHHRRLVRHDAAPLDERQSGRGTQIDGEVVGEESIDPVKQHRSPYPVDNGQELAVDVIGNGIR
jgi:hypothetical protein